MGWLSSAWNGVKQASRAVFLFIPGIVTLVVRELAWDKIFTYEAGCEASALLCGDQTCEPPSFLQENIDFLVYAVWAWSLPLMLIAYGPAFWRSTDLSNFSDHYKFSPAKGGGDEESFIDDITPRQLSRGSKCAFSGLIVAGLSYNVISLLRTYLGEQYNLGEQPFLTSQQAYGLAIALTAYWGLVSFGVKMPDYIKNTYTYVLGSGQAQDPRSKTTKCLVRGTKLLVGLGMFMTMSDYLARFIEQHDHSDSVLDFLPLILLGGALSFLYGVFVTGASLDEVQALRAKYAEKPCTVIIFSILYAIDAVLWTFLNNSQIAGRAEQWASGSHYIASNSTTFKEICRTQFHNRNVTHDTRIIINSFALLLSMPISGCMALYMLKLTLLGPKEKKKSSLAGNSQTTFPEVTHGGANDDEDCAALLPNAV
jgi:hypothetical protein